MRLELIESAADLQALASEWSAFVRSSAGSTPFQLPEWLLTWWSHFGSGRVHTLVLRDGAQMCGLLPCFLHYWEGRKQLTIVGTGVTDYLDPVLAPEAKQEFLVLLQAHLNDFCEWDVCDWPDLAIDSPLLQLRTAQVKPGLPIGETTFEGSFEQFWSERGKDLRRNLRRYRERAEQQRPLRFEVVTGVRPDLVDSVIRLHTRRWQAQGQPGMVEANQSEDFLREMAGRMDSLGIVRFFTLWFGEDLGAVIFGLLYRDKVFAYMSAFDPRYEPLGLGRTLLYESLRYAFPLYRGWNFLRGDEPYKASFGAKFIPRARLRLQQMRSS